jgi:hypothetical protein
MCNSNKIRRSIAVPKKLIYNFTHQKTTQISKCASILLSASFNSIDSNHPIESIAKHQILFHHVSFPLIFQLVPALESLVLSTIHASLSLAFASPFGSALPLFLSSSLIVAGGGSMLSSFSK